LDALNITSKQLPFATPLTFGEALH